uniref:Uncharacterized protein n=1 Tax=Tetranychus urticae TaxID=32264 RepID=T1L1H8_TETUR
MNSNSNKGLSKGQQKSINGLEEGESDDAGTNDTFFEEEFAEGLISIGDLSDLNPLNDTASTNSPDNMKKRDETPENGNQNPPSTSSTSPPIQLANADEERLDSKLDELIVNGSSDHDGELLETTIDESKRIYVNKKKRSVTPYFGRVDESLITQEEAKFTDVDDKLEKIEEALIWEALDLIKSNLDSESGDIGGKNVKNRIESRLNAAYDLEDMRISLTDLHKTMQKMSTEDDEADDNNTQNNEVDQETIFDKDDGIIFSDNIEDNGKEIGIIGHQLNQPSTPYLSDNHHDQMKPKDYSSNPDDSDDCKAIQLLTSDCSAVKDIVPSGPLEKIFVRACNWHEVCYSCVSY